MPIASSLVVGKPALHLLFLGCTVVKDSSRVYAVGLAELMRRAQQANSTLYELLPIISIAGVLACPSHTVGHESGLTYASSSGLSFSNASSACRA
jgi:hypothetical protein